MPALVPLLLSALSAAPAPHRFELAEWLARPYVRLVAVEVFSPACKACVDAAPKWKALRDRHRNDGFRLVVIGDRCAKPPYEVDELVCDTHSALAAKLAGTRALEAGKPASYLFTWQGEPLVERADVDAVAAAAEKWLREPFKAALPADRPLREELARTGKFVVIDKPPPLPETLEACGDEDHTLTPGSVIRARVDENGLTLDVYSLERGCIIASASGDSSAPREAVEQLFRTLSIPYTPHVEEEREAAAEPEEHEDETHEELPPPRFLPATLLELPTPPSYTGISTQALKQVEDAHIDPPKARVERMLRGAFTALHAQIPAFTFEPLEKGRAGAHYAGVTRSFNLKDSVEITELGPIFQNIAELLAKNSKEFTRAGIEMVLLDGALSTLDRNSAILIPSEYAAKNADLAERAGGIGVDVAMIGGKLRIVQPVPGAPSAKAGLRPGDILVAIDDRPTKEMNIDQAVRNLRGSVGTQVSVTITRDGWAAPRRYNFTRGLAEATEVESRRLEGDVGYIAIRMFSKNAMEELNQSLERLPPHRRKLRGLILDVRDTWAGAPETALALADRFLSQGEMAVLATRSSREAKNATASGNDVTELPVVVLVSGATAFAGELFAGALQALDRAVVAGERTAGQASRLSTFPLDFGFAVTLPTAQYLGSGGKKLEGIGLTPDVLLSASAKPSDRDQAVATVRRWLEAAGSARRSDVLAAAHAASAKERPRR